MFISVITYKYGVAIDLKQIAKKNQPTFWCE